MNKQLLSLFLTLSIGAMSFTLSGSIEVMSPQPNDVVYMHWWFGKTISRR